MAMTTHYQNVIKEYADLKDSRTFDILTSINEADQNKALVNITSKLYDSIVDKVTDIDFGDIERTKGDFAKLPDYEKIMSTVDILRDLLKEYGQNPYPVSIIDDAIDNVLERTGMFELAFKTNTEFPMIAYNTIVLSIISSVSFMISTSIEYIKNTSDDSFDIIVDKVSMNKTKESILFRNLERFNRTCKNGTFDKAMDHVIKAQSENLIGAIAFTTGLVIAGIALVILPMLRELVYFFYYSRVRISDYLNMQADLLQMNAYRVERSETRTPEANQNIANKQNKIADTFRKIANKLEVTSKKAEKETDKEISKIGKKKYNADEIFADQAPDSASALF